MTTDATLAKIATLQSHEEVAGWRDAVRLIGRAMVPGETAALLEQERILTMTSAGRTT